MEYVQDLTEVDLSFWMSPEEQSAYATVPEFEAYVSRRSFYEERAASLVAGPVSVLAGCSSTEGLAVSYEAPLESFTDFLAGTPRRDLGENAHNDHWDSGLGDSIDGDTESSLSLALNLQKQTAPHNLYVSLRDLVDHSRTTQPPEYPTVPRGLNVEICSELGGATSAITIPERYYASLQPAARQKEHKVHKLSTDVSSEDKKGPRSALQVRTTTKHRALRPKPSTIIVNNYRVNEIPTKTPKRGSKKMMATVSPLSGNELATFPCPHVQCTKQFTRPCDLRKHVKQHVRPNKCPYPDCVYHEKGFPAEKDLLRHQQDRHEKKTNFRCHLCNAYSSTRRSNLSQHLEKQHQIPYHRTKGPKANVSRRPRDSSRNVTGPEMSPSASPRTMQGSPPTSVGTLSPMDSPLEYGLPTPIDLPISYSPAPSRPMERLDPLKVFQEGANVDASLYDFFGDVDHGFLRDAPGFLRNVPQSPAFEQGPGVDLVDPRFNVELDAELMRYTTR